MERNYRLRVHWAVIYNGTKRKSQRTDVGRGSGTVWQWKGEWEGMKRGAAREWQKVNL